MLGMWQGLWPADPADPLLLHLWFLRPWGGIVGACTRWFRRISFLGRRQIWPLRPASSTSSCCRCPMRGIAVLGGDIVCLFSIKFGYLPHSCQLFVCLVSIKLLILTALLPTVCLFVCLFSIKLLILTTLLPTVNIFNHFSFNPWSFDWLIKSWENIDLFTIRTS